MEFFNKYIEQDHLKVLELGYIVFDPKWKYYSINNQTLQNIAPVRPIPYVS